jgi:hypothetical protein
MNASERQEWEREKKWIAEQINALLSAIDKSESVDALEGRLAEKVRQIEKGPVITHAVLEGVRKRGDDLHRSFQRLSEDFRLTKDSLRPR